jgi:chitinase
MRRRPLLFAALVLAGCNSILGNEDHHLKLDTDPTGTGGAGGSSGGTPAGGAGPALAGNGGTSVIGTAGAAQAGSTAQGGGAAGAAQGGAAGAGGAGTPIRVVGYLPDYDGLYRDWAMSIDFTKMTYVDLAFAVPDTNSLWGMGTSDADTHWVIDAAHLAGTKVLACLGGADGDLTVAGQYKTAASTDLLVTNLVAYLDRLHFDGVDIDIEHPTSLGADYSAFVSKTIAALHPKSMVVSATVAQYLQGSMSDDTLHSFDFINVQIYSNNVAYNTSQADYYAVTKAEPKSKIQLGVAFYGTGTSSLYKYGAILAADSNAWNANQTTVAGETINYTGVARMQELLTLSKNYGGVSAWALSQDAIGEHSLWKAIQDSL